jgi:hypothetical protein
MLVEIRGTNLPGRRCGPSPEGTMYDNVHVGIGRGDSLAGLVPGDAPSARWQIDVRTRVRDEGDIDFGGSFVRGKRRARFLYLSWGTVSDDSTFTLFRAAKLWLSEVEPALLEDAMQHGRRLVGTLCLTNHKGQPLCASVRPPMIRWAVEQE